MGLEFINPTTLGAPSGYANGVLVPNSGQLLFIAGQVAWNERHEIVSLDFVDQFERSLANVIAIVEEAGGRASDICRLTIYVTSRQEYITRTSEIGERYRKYMNKHFPAMVLVVVSGLLEEAAKIEIEGMAVIQSS
jgi:enamine deaminase RidA (YjgF/YER057c/UK114 family)